MRLYLSERLPVLILTLFCSISYANGEISTATSLEAAFQLAQQQKKHVFLYFTGSDWCSNCKLLKKKVLSQPEFLTYAGEHLVLFNVDFPVKKKALSKEQKAINKKIIEEYNKEGLFPYSVILTPNKKIIGALSGYRNGKPEVYINKIKRLIQNQ